MAKDQDALVALACRPEGSGFWYRVSGRRLARYWFTFIALGVGGHQAAGELSGAVSTGDWEYHALHFPVMHVGYTSLDVSVDGSGDWIQTSPVVPRESTLTAPTAVVAESGEDEKTTFSSPFSVA